MKHLILITLLCASIGVQAATPAWEYRVVYLPGTVAGSQTQPMPGGLIDLDKTATLNHLSQDGWEVISVTGDVGADHAVYMRRRPE